jgi:hypothetical protein
MISIAKITEILNESMNINTPALPLPPTLVKIGGSNRPGLSPSTIASRIISRQNEAGVKAGLLPDGSDNLSEKMERIRIEEIVNAIITEMRIDVTVPTGVPIQATGGNAGGPIVVVGSTILDIPAYGIAR